MFYAHRLVAEAFLENKNNLPVVNHIDGNKLNNCVNNLEWVSYNDNAKHYHNIIKKNKKNKVTEKYTSDLKDEIWVLARDNDNYLVSSYGRVRNIKNNNILSQGPVCGYKKVRLSKNGKVKDWTVHKLVFFSFNLNKDPNDKTLIIDHIDGNKSNNNLSNLRQITISENVVSAYYNQKTNSNIKPINQFSKDGMLIATFPSSREAGRQLKLDSSSIIKCCKGKVKSVGGFIFHYA